ncbi:hypothetical protein Cgig2_025680 [Carnegiea gigantea]|uniref:AB hydrolase-1 domain-containing protein n=1 Tax=Carnegiea gigantea TaxID=171969 RepID=A0A9Q1JU54_9CARY|nr:hypothetical protein Cgig2_025680 [Carnegiea gigantea]
MSSSPHFLMIFRALSIPIAKWIKQLAQLLHGLLSFIVFTTLDFMDSVFCVVFAYLDEFFEGNNYVSAPCYCLKKRRVNEGGDDDNGERESQLSETLYGDCKRNVFRELGLRRRFEESKEKVGFGSELGKREKRNRWSDCSCQSCISWLKDGNDLRLHVVVQAPEGPQACDGNLEGKSIENVIFLHGFISSSSFWTETVFCNLSEEAKQKYRLFAVDLFGFGRSPKPPGCLYTLKDHVEMIEKSVIFPFELNSFHLVAHSMGSTVALALAAKYPEAVKSVTLIAPPCIASRGDGASSSALEKFAGKKLWPPLLFGAAFMSWYEHLGRIVCFIVCRNHRLWESILRILTWRRDHHFMIMDLTRHTHHSAWHTMHNVICGGARFTDEFLEILSNMRVTITVIQGNEDQVVPLECSYSIKKRVPEVDVRIISGTDHITVILSRAEEFTRDLEGIWSSCN